METTTPIYDEYYEDERCNTTSIIDFGNIVTPLFYSIVTILGLIGNILALVILVKYENLKSITNTLILNLAISDLVFTASLPIWAHYHLYGWTLGESLCKIIHFIFYLGFYSCSIILILMTVYRYIAVIAPLSNIVSTTGFYSIIVSVIVWVMSILAASPAYIFSKTEESGYCGYMKQNWNLYWEYMQNGVFMLSSLVFVFCYSHILYRLLRPSPQRRNKTLKLIFILVVVFFVGWAPYNITIFWQTTHFWPDQAKVVLADICETEKKLHFAFYISRFFAFSHCCLNPVFYVFVTVKFKTHLKKILQRWCNKKSVQKRQSRLTIVSLTSGEDLNM